VYGIAHLPAARKATPTPGQANPPSAFVYTQSAPAKPFPAAPANTPATAPASSVTASILAPQSQNPTPTHLPPTKVIITPSLVPSATTPVHPSAWNQGKLFYLMGQSASRSLYAVDIASGSQATLLANPIAGEMFLGPVVSPNGGMVVYYNMSWQMKTITLDPHSVQKVANCTTPAFSPDGSRVICAPFTGEHFTIYDSQTCLEISQVQVNMSGITIPAWSSQDEIVYSVRSGSTGNPKTSIWKVALSGGNPQALAKSSSENYAPAWSPDGAWIAFQSNKGTNNSEIWVMDRMGQHARRLTDNPNGWARGPYWSPDGQWIAYVSSPNGPDSSELGEIFVISPTSGETHQVTDTGNLVYDWRVTWSK